MITRYSVRLNTWTGGLARGFSWTGSKLVSVSFHGHASLTPRMGIYLERTPSGSAGRHWAKKLAKAFGPSVVPCRVELALSLSHAPRKKRHLLTVNGQGLRLSSGDAAALPIRNSVAVHVMAWNLQAGRHAETLD